MLDKLMDRGYKSGENVNLDASQLVIATDSLANLFNPLIPNVVRKVYIPREKNRIKVMMVLDNDLYV